MENKEPKSEYEFYKAQYEVLKTKYDNILATESGHESKTENVWQSGYAAGHDVGSEQRITAAAERIADKLMVIVRKQLREPDPINPAIYDRMKEAKANYNSGYERGRKELVDPDFIEFITNERNAISNEMLSDEWWLSIPAAKRVAFENVLIAYDQMMERFKASNIGESTPSGREEDGVSFVNWTLSSDCDTYTCTDEDQWTNINTQENITTAQLYDIFKQKEGK